MEHFPQLYTIMLRRIQLKEIFALEPSDEVSSNDMTNSHNSSFDKAFLDCSTNSFAGFLLVTIVGCTVDQSAARLVQSEKRPTIGI
jgi:hypothetical protein